MLLVAGSTLRAPDQALKLDYQPVEGGPWEELPLETSDTVHWNLWVDSFEAQGIDPTRTYRGRFEGQGEAGQRASEDFVFCPCEKWLRIDVKPRGQLGPPYVLLYARLDSPVAEARVTFTLEPLGELPIPLGTFDLVPVPAEDATLFELDTHYLERNGVIVLAAPLPDVTRDCARRLKIGATVRTVDGTSYPSSQIESACQRLGMRLPGECRFGLKLRQTFPGCSGSPDTLSFAASGYAEAPGPGHDRRRTPRVTDGLRLLRLHPRT